MIYGNKFIKFDRSLQHSLNRPFCSYKYVMAYTYEKRIKNYANFISIFKYDLITRDWKKIMSDESFRNDFHVFGGEVDEARAM